MVMQDKCVPDPPKIWGKLLLRAAHPIQTVTDTTNSPFSPASWKELETSLELQNSKNLSEDSQKYQGGVGASLAVDSQHYQIFIQK